MELNGNFAAKVSGHYMQNNFHGTIKGVWVQERNFFYEFQNKDVQYTCPRAVNQGCYCIATGRILYFNVSLGDVRNMICPNVSILNIICHLQLLLNPVRKLSQLNPTDHSKAMYF